MAVLAIRENQILFSEGCFSLKSKKLVRAATPRPQYWLMEHIGVNLSSVEISNN